MDSVPTTPPHAHTFISSPPLPQPQHQYGTRIRQNSILKPSARLRGQSPDTPSAHRRIKPVPTAKTAPFHSPQPELPPFPPPHVMLHPDDVGSKVFMAIGRSFLSVDNRAMTIKDLAEMTLKYGLVCQNVSAAGQAITTYIRTHLQRCDAQEDHPLLLRHVLSGTSADDDLLPALHSRTGGAHCTINPENRSTNFRRGTMVWYLSKATGAPCPFARAGINLCDYGENGKIGLPVGARERKRDRDRQRRLEQCGQKRKRLLRGCANQGSDSESGNEENRLPKVKLTLRLQPPCLSPSSTSTGHSSSLSIEQSTGDVIDLSKYSDSDEDSFGDSMSVDSSDDEQCSPTSPASEAPFKFPAYPPRSISIPPYTPTVNEHSAHFLFSPPSQTGKPEEFRRSPSVPYSIASPPPDSEEEDDDYHISMTGARRFSTGRLCSPDLDTIDDFDLDFDSDGELDGETETLWESPGPRSPSAPIVPGNMPHVVIKQELQDVQGMLEEWEDFDSTEKRMDVDTSAGWAESTNGVKIEEAECAGWDMFNDMTPYWFDQMMNHQEMAQSIKQEEEEATLMSAPIPCGHGLSSPLSPLSSVSSQSSSFFSGMSPDSIALRSHNELLWKDVELLGPDSIHPQEFEEGWQTCASRSNTVRARARTSPNLPSFVAKPATRPFSPLQDTPISGSDTARPSTLPSALTRSLAQLQNNSSTRSAPRHTAHNDVDSDDIVVVHTCQPCTPAICATQVEGISVYQMTLGSSPLLRRIDTDFVNLSPVANHLGLSSPSLKTLPNAIIIPNSSPSVTGTWVPLAAARTFVKGRPLPSGLLDIFLSNSLFERFPPALHDFHRSNTPGRLLNKFGPHFKSTLEQRQSSQLTIRTVAPFIEDGRSPWEREPVSDWDVEDHLLSIHPPLGLTHAMHPTSNEVVEVVEPPLSSTEQEMFHTLCVIQDWEKEGSVVPNNNSHLSLEEVPDVAEEEVITPPSYKRLRRSQRVANISAASTRPRTRSQRAGTRNNSIS